MPDFGSGQSNSLRVVRMPELHPFMSTCISLYLAAELQPSASK